jgi:transcription termination/antitermination protein NusA
MKIKYSKELLAHMKIFSRITHASLKDSFEYDNTLYFIVEVGQIGKAIGKGGSVVRDLQQKFKRRIRVVEYNQDATKFVSNLIYPIKADVRAEEGKIIISCERAKRGQLIGRDAKNLNMLKLAAQRYFNVSDITVE